MKTLSTAALAVGLLPAAALVRLRACTGTAILNVAISVPACLAATAIPLRAISRMSIVASIETGE